MASLDKMGDSVYMNGVHRWRRGGASQSPRRHAAEEAGMARVWDDILRQRISRRRALARAGGAALGAAGIALVGCTDGGAGGDGGPGPSPDPNETPTRGGILRTRQTNVSPPPAP